MIVTGIVSDTQVQMGLFEEEETYVRKQQVSAVLDQLNSKYGQSVVKYAIQGTAKKWKLRQEQLTPCYTTRWEDLLRVKIG